jgi:hypothetical protein
MPDVPILTVKLRSVTLDRGVGPDIRIKVQADDGPLVERIGSARRKRWLLQKPSSANSVGIHMEVAEEREPYPESTSRDETLHVDTSSPPKRGSDTFSVVLEAVGGDKGKTAEFTFTYEWFVSTNVKDVVAFIHEKMTSNLRSSDFTAIKKAKGVSNQLSKNALMMYYGAEAQHAGAIAAGSQDAEAMLRFLFKVQEGSDWDYKIPIHTRFGQWALDAPRARKYEFDIWANMHFGYIGSAAGFSEDVLLDYAGFDRLNRMAGGALF